MYRKDDILRQRRLNHSGRGEGDYGTQSHAVEPDRWADRQMGSWAGWHLERWVDRCAAGEHAGRQGGQAVRQVSRQTGGQEGRWATGRQKGR